MDQSSRLQARRSHQKQLTFTGRNTNREKVSVLLVGSPELCYLMQESLYHSFKKIHRNEITISVSESIENILKSSVELHNDYIVFLMDTTRRQALEQVERDICLLDHIYLCDKTVLVNCCNNLTRGYLGVSYDELFNLAQKYRLHILHGNIRDEGSCTSVANRIITLLRVVCGMKSGRPIALHFPANKYPIY